MRCLLSCSSEDKVKKEEETDDHGSYDDICTIASVPGDFLKSCRTKLERLGRGSNTVALLLHLVQLTLIFKHPVQVATHFVSDLIKSLLDIVLLGGLFVLFQI